MFSNTSGAHKSAALPRPCVTHMNESRQQEKEEKRERVCVYVCVCKFTLLRIISGARYSGVPQRVQVFEPGGTILAKPKSHTLMLPL